METETKLKIKGIWSDLKSKLQKKFPKLTNDDLLFTKGQEDDLMDRITKRLKKSQDEVHDIFDELQSDRTVAKKETTVSAKKQVSGNKEKQTITVKQTKKTNK